MSKLYSERTHFTVRMVENMAKMKIAVLFGGASSEHEVSLVSAYSVLTNIPKDKYDVMCIGITKKGHWLCYPGEYEDIRTGEWENNPDNCTAVISPDTVSKGVILLGADDKCYIRRLDAVFPVLHGRFGEDGTVQAKSGETGIFIYPGYRFRAVDALITNFHLPQSTLLMLVSAFYDREHILEAYRTAVKERYRFFSFGDAMLIQ